MQAFTQQQEERGCFNSGGNRHRQRQSTQRHPADPAEQGGKRKAEGYIQPHRSSAHESRCFRVMHRKESPHEYFQNAVKNQTDRITEQRPGGHLGGKGCEVAALKQEGDQWLAQQDQPQGGRNGQQQHPPQSRG